MVKFINDNLCLVDPNYSGNSKVTGSDDSNDSDNSNFE